MTYQGFVAGKEITVDGERYKIRLINGGNQPKSEVDRHMGGLPNNNEWDRWIVNNDNISGLPIPTPGDLKANASASDSAHNVFWNWRGVSHITSEPTSNGRVVYRGDNSASNFAMSSDFGAQGFRPVLEVLNTSPTLTLNTSNNKTLYEKDSFLIDGITTDTDLGDVVTVKYQINSGTVRNLHSSISNGATPIPFTKNLTYSEGVLKDGNAALTSVLSKDSPHVISVWSEDGNGGKSAVETRTFYVVPNRPPTITVDPIASKSDLINSNVINVSGNVGDLDSNAVVVTFQINDDEPQEVHNGAPGIFSFNIVLKDLRNGSNTVIVKAVDTYDASISKVLTIKKKHNAVPIDQAIALYKITPPTGSAQKI